MIWRNDYRGKIVAEKSRQLDRFRLLFRERYRDRDFSLNSSAMRRSARDEEEFFRRVFERSPPDSR